MGKTHRHKTTQIGLSRRIKWAMKKKRKTYKNLEVNNGNYLNKLLANEWDWS